MHSSRASCAGGRMRRWLELLDPRARIETEAQALAALRLGDIALVASAPLSVLSAVFTKLPPDLIANAALTPITSPEEQQVVDAMAAVMPQFMLAGAVVGALITFGLAALQWRYRTWIIPGLCLLLVGYSLVMLPFAWSNEMAAAVRELRPIWLTALDWITLVAGAAMFWAAFRGGRWLERARRGAQAPAAS